MTAPENTHAVLRLLLRALCALIGVGGLVLIVATGPTLHLFVNKASAEETAWLMVALKALGAVALFISYLLYHTARDPVRYVAVIDAVSGLLILLAILDAYAALALGFGAYFPVWFTFTRVFVRLALAFILIYLRPRAAS